MRIFKLIIFIFLLGIVSGYLYLKHIGILNGNSYSIYVDNSLSKNDFKIYQGFFTINRENDYELFDNVTRVPFFDGNKKTKIKSDHGENDFLITYKDSLYYQFRYFKTNNRMVDNFNFHFSYVNDSLYVKVNIKGTNTMEFRRPFNSISRSKYLRTNVPLDSAGVMYNGLELIN